MGTGLGLSLRASQHLALTPQLQQSIRLLQLSALELKQEIQQMLEQNPCLLEEEDEDGEALEAMQDFRPESSSDVSDTHEQDSVPEPDIDGPTDWEGADGCADLDTLHSEWTDVSPSSGQGTDDVKTPEDADESSDSLVEHLQTQAAALRLNALDRCVLLLLIHSLDEHGFLTESDAELVEALQQQGLHGTPNEDLESAVALARALLCQMDPVGIGARDATHSLRAQAVARQRAASSYGGPGGDRWHNVARLLDLPLALLARRELAKMAKACDLAESEVNLALADLRTLNPRPASAFGRVQRTAVVPEVIVRRVGTRLMVEINPAARPRLGIDAALASALKGAGKSAVLQDQLQEAKWFVKNIRQRYDTILRVSQIIAERQRRFFLYGPTQMKPLVLREVADELGVHESTVSRVTTAKYLQSAMGTFELKYFFAPALATASGSNTSATAVKAMLSEMFRQENPKAPLSDAHLADALEKVGIICARRTVAKYREALQIPVAHLRQRLI